MLKMAMIGDKGSILAFKSFGFDIFPALNLEKARSNWEQLDKSQYGIVFITEPYFKEMQESLAKIAEDPLPTVLSIPSTTGSDGFSMERIKTVVQKAVGTELFT